MIRLAQCQTDFRTFSGQKGLFGFLGRYGGVPTNVGCVGDVQLIAVIRSKMSVRQATKRINEAILNMEYENVLEAIEDQKKMAMDHGLVYLLGSIKMILRPRMLTKAK